MRILIALAVAALCFAPEASRAYGPAPWCAVISFGWGDTFWDCQYGSIEECRPHVIAGWRGFCNMNPAWQGPYEPAPRPKGRRKHPIRHD